MEIIKYPGREEWSSLIKRPALDVTTLFDTVRTVLDEVREQGSERRETVRSLSVAGSGRLGH